MKAFAVILGAALVNAAAIAKRAERVISADSITATGFNFPLEGNVQPFVVDKSGFYRVSVRGAGGGLGGNDSTTSAGKGAVVQGAYLLLSTDRYIAVVGQKGGNGVGTPQLSAGGGDGGSFVYKADNTLLVAAGGGGGNSLDGKYLGLNAISNATLIGDGFGGSANAGAGAAGAGFGFADEKGSKGDGENAGVVQGALGGKTKNDWTGGAVEIRQKGAKGQGGFGGGGGGGKNSGGGGGGYSGGNGGPDPGSLAGRKSGGLGGTSFVRTEAFNGLRTYETTYGAATNAGNGVVSIRYLPYIAYTPPVAAP